jgi:molybdopterin-guanine dinucleotide biosynthesis protein B
VPLGQRVLALVGHSGAGKTTSLCLWIPHLLGLGYRVAVVKHSHHPAGPELGKDSQRLALAGACWVHFCSGEVDWSEVVAQAPSCDLLFIEGGSSSPFEKLEIVRGRPARLPRPAVLARIGEDLAYLSPVQWTDWLLGQGLGPPGS